MDLLKGPKAKVQNPIPVIGIESSPIHFSESDQGARSKLRNVPITKLKRVVLSLDMKWKIGLQPKRKPFNEHCKYQT
jgi:hypothetical protein